MRISKIAGQRRSQRYESRLAKRIGQYGLILEGAQHLVEVYAGRDTRIEEARKACAERRLKRERMIALPA